jgi:acyl-CoA synthetase (AMP-forming)/AMP-acid ligase II
MTLVDVLRRRAELHPAKTVYGTITEDRAWTYAELDRQARAIAVRLDCLAANARVVILHSSPLDFAAAFFGCLYAGCVPVPVQPPRSNRGIDHIRRIAVDSGAELVLAGQGFASLAGTTEGWSLPWLPTDDRALDDADSWRPRPCAGDSIALLQYTSGSTSNPKGVVVRNDQLLANQAMIADAFGHDEHTRVASWLPLHHDMGLIGCLLNPLFVGGTAWFMDPLRFIQRPVRWLEAIGRLGITTAGAPNFAYDLCCDRIAPEQREKLNLSSWTLAFCGAEPVRGATLERFAATFAPCGFRREALYPCYGLAEATLYVSGGTKGEGPLSLRVRAAALAEGRIEVSAAPADPTFVDCGYARPGQEFAIVNPENRVRMEDGRVGEILVAGPSVAAGYWNRPEATAEVFSASVEGSTSRFLRTGDLGFIHRGRLFVTGRLKDLMIIDGRNHHAEDVELSVRAGLADIGSGACCAFIADGGAHPGLVVVVELPARSFDRSGEVFRAVRRAVAHDHDLEAGSVVIVEMGGIPRTSSGKLRRASCREAIASGALRPRQTWSRRESVE